MSNYSEQAAKLNAGFWATKCLIQLQSDIFSFANHEYQIEPMTVTCRRRCYIKATQGGWTEIEVLRSLWAMIHKHHPKGDLYTFPTATDVDDFAKSRFNPLISSNIQAIGRFVKPAGKGTDTANLKKIHDAFLYLRGTKLNKKISDLSESTRLRGIPVDCIKFDEYDLMDDDVAAKARGRYGHSLIKEEVFLSNPTCPDEGIDAVFQDSDQRHWWHKCTYRKNDTSATNAAGRKVPTAHQRQSPER